jgi:hypothetical protein
MGLTKGETALLVAADASANCSPVANSNAKPAKIKMQENLDRMSQLMNYRKRQRNCLRELSMSIIRLSIPRQTSMQFNQCFGSATEETASK